MIVESEEALAQGDLGVPPVVSTIEIGPQGPNAEIIVRVV